MLSAARGREIPEFSLFSLFAQGAPSKLGDGLEPDIRKVTAGDAGDQDQHAQDVKKRLRDIELMMKQLLAKHDDAAGGNSKEVSCLGSPPAPQPRYAMTGQPASTQFYNLPYQNGYEITYGQGSRNQEPVPPPRRSVPHAQTGVGPAFACGGDPTIYHSTPAPDVVDPDQGSSILPDVLGDLVFWKDPDDRSAQ